MAPVLFFLLKLAQGLTVGALALGLGGERLRARGRGVLRWSGIEAESLAERSPLWCASPRATVHAGSLLLWGMEPAVDRPIALERVSV
jgi:hypothetical protein